MKGRLKVRFAVTHHVGVWQPGEERHDDLPWQAEVYGMAARYTPARLRLDQDSVVVPVGQWEAPLTWALKALSALCHAGRHFGYTAAVDVAWRDFLWAGGRASVVVPAVLATARAVRAGGGVLATKGAATLHLADPVPLPAGATCGKCRRPVLDARPSRADGVGLLVALAPPGPAYRLMPVLVCSDACRAVLDAQNRATRSTGRRPRRRAAVLT